MSSDRSRTEASLAGIMGGETTTLMARPGGSMFSIAADPLPLLALFAPAFTPATFARVHLLAIAAILTTGRRTVSNLWRLVGHLGDGDPSSYHRVLSAAHWSGLRLAALLGRFL